VLCGICVLGVACAAVACSASSDGATPGTTQRNTTQSDAVAAATPRRPHLAAKPVAVKLGSTFEVRVRFRHPATMPGVAQSASSRRCGFYRTNLHTLSDRKNISCAEAKRILLRLRGRRDTIPMICGKSRVIHGWRLESRSRQWSAVVNRYSRGRQSFIYLREQNAYRVYCPPKGGYTSEGV
jgi:hypothetical protein